MDQFNVLELYSGIGGFHYAIKKLFKLKGINNYRITGVDINTTANEIYKHNHVGDEDKSIGNILLERNIQSISVKELDKNRYNLITMSPPCQPFSRLGLKRDLSDNRCNSFRHLMSTLPLLENKPEYIMLENVKGFETSDAHQLLVETLIRCDYRFEEFLLSPTQFSIPNSRQRYYLIGRKVGTNLTSNKYKPNIHTKVPVIESNNSIFDSKSVVEYVDQISIEEQSGLVFIGEQFQTIESYLDNKIDEQYELNNETLLRYHMLFDLVDHNSFSTNCFTKAYAHRIEGCGSILKAASDSVTIDDVYTLVKQLKKQKDEQNCSSDNGNDFDDAIVQALRSLHLRYFTPREIANLMSFPSEFEFPDKINRKQQYRVLGNSVNVTVCYYLLRILIGSISE
ncbi:hypothetical protein RDWZM_006043 [Blomia tropicalis]|uniref:Cytosine-specific methyltransferase n=1 Tax=Blomia tropicalis TaxID=40697 RepID=A0A9Q0M6B6_BLOTA|nr:hypothetical protein RDWZM_006043 [Blomia tropicalis]